MDFTSKLSELWPEQEKIMTDLPRFEISASLPMANKVFKSYDFNDFEVEEIEKALSCENKGEFDIKVLIYVEICQKFSYVRRYCGTCDFNQPWQKRVFVNPYRNLKV